MANEVVKKDGTREPFDEEKIRRAVEMASREAGLAAERTAEVVDQVSQKIVDMAASKEEITTSEIRDAILSELDMLEPTVSAAWRTYEQAKGV